MTLRRYEITFRGDVVPAIVVAFEGFDVFGGEGTGTLRSEGMDQAALHGAIARLQDLGLELLTVTSLEPAGPDGAPQSLTRLQRPKITLHRTVGRSSPDHTTQGDDHNLPSAYRAKEERRRDDQPTAET